METIRVVARVAVGLLLFASGLVLMAASVLPFAVFALGLWLVVWGGQVANVRSEDRERRRVAEKLAGMGSRGEL